MGCRRCPLWEGATQTVFGAGPLDAPLMIVGEQPGDQEDRTGIPFVGPAGKVLDEALDLAGIDRDGVYVTNAVKHFKWKPQGRRRIHDKPNRTEVVACRPWLEQEITIVGPSVLVALGATAAQSLLGPAFRLTRHHGEVLTDTGWAPQLLATIHPSVVLRGRDAAAREASRGQLVDDLRAAAACIQTS
jgi:uracil-DNA glycosylase family protein